MKQWINILFVIFIACGSVKHTKELNKNVFKTILRETGGEIEFSPGFHVLNSKKDISKFKDISNFSVLKSIDFTKVTLVAVVDKVQNSGGYGIAITSFDEVDGNLMCSYEKSSPGPKDMVTMALTQPFHIVSIKKTYKKIIFKEL